MQLIGILLEVPSVAHIKGASEARRCNSRFSPPHRNGQDPIHFLRPRCDAESSGARNTYLLPARFCRLSCRTAPKVCGSPLVRARQSGSGDVAVATGFPDALEGFLALTDGEIQDTNIFEPIQPQPRTYRQERFGTAVILMAIKATWYPSRHERYGS